MKTTKLLFVLLIAVCGCHKATGPGSNGSASWQPPQTLQVAGTPPPLGSPRSYDSSVTVYQSEIPLTEGIEQVWVYLPAPLPTRKLPCVFIAPAGSMLFHGMALGNGDRPEHIPYVQAGFAVVAYSLSGPLMGDNPSESMS